MIDFTFEQNGNKTIVPLSGDLDYISRKYFVQCMKALIEAGERNLVINCGRVNSINSVAIGTLIVIQKYAAKRGGSVQLVQVNSLIADVLNVTGLSDTFKIFA